MDVSDGDIVKVVEELVVVICRIVLKLFYPELEIRKNLPLGLPLLLQDPPWWVLEIQAEKKGVRAWVILFNNCRVLDECGEQGLLQVVLRQAFDVLAVSEVPVLPGFLLTE